MSFKEKFNNKNPLNGNPPVKPLPHLETNIVTRGLMSAFYGSDAKDKMLGSANKLIDLYNKREDSNVMTEEEREYRRDLLKSISSNKRNSEGVRRSISTNLRMPDVVNEQVLVDLDKYTSEDGTQVEYVTEDFEESTYNQMAESEKQRTAIALGLYDDIPEDKRLFTKSDMGWKPSSISNLTDKEIAIVKNKIKEKGKNGKIEFSDLLMSLAPGGPNNNNGVMHKAYLDFAINNGLLNEDSNRPPEIYLNENDEVIYEQRASTVDDLHPIAKPFVDVDNLKEIEESGIIQLPNIKFKL